MLNWPLAFGPDEDTFTWEEKPSINRVALGDGYAQRSGRLSNNLRKWSLTWSNLAASDKDLAVNFCRGLRGVDGCNWLPPGQSESIVVKVPSWTVRRVGGGYWIVSAVFQELPEVSTARQDATLREDGTYLLREDGSRILLEGVWVVADALLREDGSYLLREDGSHIALEG